MLKQVSDIATLFTRGVNKRQMAARLSINRASVRRMFAQRHNPVRRRTANNGAQHAANHGIEAATGLSPPTQRKPKGTAEMLTDATPAVRA